MSIFRWEHKVSNHRFFFKPTLFSNKPEWGVFVWPGLLTKLAESVCPTGPRHLEYMSECMSTYFMSRARIGVRIYVRGDVRTKYMSQNLAEQMLE